MIGKHTGKKKRRGLNSFEPCPRRFSLSETLTPCKRTWHSHGKTSLQACYSGATRLFWKQSSSGPNAWVAEATLSELAEALNEQCSIANYRLQIYRPNLEPGLPAFSSGSKQS